MGKTDAILGLKSGVIGVWAYLHKILVRILPKSIHTPFFVFKIVTFCIIITAFSITAFAQTPGLSPQLYQADAQLNAIIYGAPGSAPATPRGMSQREAAMMSGASSGGPIAPGRGRGLADAQDDYYSAHGRFWQGLATHRDTPHGPRAPDNLGRRPSDQPHGWASIGIELPPVMESALRVDVYDGPCGQGYTITARRVVTDTLWQRIVNVGCESWRATGWTPQPFLSPLEP